MSYVHTSGRQVRWLVLCNSLLVKGPVVCPLSMSYAHLLDIVFLQRLGCAVHRVLLHVLGHVRIFDHSLAVSHLCFCTEDGEIVSGGAGLWTERALKLLFLLSLFLSAPPPPRLLVKRLCLLGGKVPESPIFAVRTIVPFPNKPFSRKAYSMEGGLRRRERTSSRLSWGCPASCAGRGRSLLRFALASYLRRAGCRASNSLPVHGRLQHSNKYSQLLVVSFSSFSWPCEEVRKSAEISGEKHPLRAIRLAQRSEADGWLSWRKSRRQ
jgi:hypothetical protein